MNLGCHGLVGMHRSCHGSTRLPLNATNYIFPDPHVRLKILPLAILQTPRAIGTRPWYHQWVCGMWILIPSFGVDAWSKDVYNTSMWLAWAYKQLPLSSSKHPCATLCFFVLSPSKFALLFYLCLCLSFLAFCQYMFPFLLKFDAQLQILQRHPVKYSFVFQVLTLCTYLLHDLLPFS